MINSTKTNESCGESESDMWEDEHFYVGEAFNHPHTNGCFLYEIIRKKALAIVQHNKMFSKDIVDVEDAVNLVLVLFQTGNLDLYSNPEDFEDQFFFRVDEETKKVNQLVVQKASQSDGPLQFPVEMISSLDELKDLKLSNVNVTSSNFNALSSNAVQASETKSQFFRKQRPLRNLKKLDVSYFKMDKDGAILETHCFHLLPKLESITFRMFTGRTERTYIQNVLSDIGSSFCACQKTLRSINMSHSMFTQDELKTLLVNVVPKLPNLVEINVSANKIESIQRVAKCIRARRGIVNNSLQILDLSWNGVISKINDNPKEKAALMTILRTFKGLYDIGNNINMAEYQPDMKYQLHINHAGRRLIENCNLNSKTISKSLMPFVLERAFQKSQDIYPLYWQHEREKDPTGMYYLLRSGSILQGCPRRRKGGNDFIQLCNKDHGDVETRKCKRRKVYLCEIT